MGSSMERRQLIAGVVAILAAVGLPTDRLSASETPIDLDWPDLIPEMEITNAPSGFSLASRGDDQDSVKASASTTG